MGGACVGGGVLRRPSGPAAWRFCASAVISDSAWTVALRGGFSSCGLLLVVAQRCCSVLLAWRLALSAVVSL